MRIELTASGIFTQSSYLRLWDQSAFHGYLKNKKNIF